MGTWGVGIFDNDLTNDIKEEYDYLIMKGLDFKEVETILIERFNEEINDDEEDKVFWLGLAAIQLEDDYITPEVRKNTLQVINSGDDLLNWQEDNESYSLRKEILENLKLKINSTF